MGIKQRVKTIMNSKYAVLIRNKLNIHNFLISARIGQSNRFFNAGGVLSAVKIRVYGKNNRIVIGKKCRLSACRFTIYGNDNTVLIDDNCLINESSFWIEDNGNSIHLKSGTTVFGKTQFAAIEGTSITVGEDCMFASDIQIRTGDSHSVTDLDGQRVNPSRNIDIGGHVWVGERAVCLKGVSIPNDCIVAVGAVVNKPVERSNVIVGGIPAKIVKTDISWNRKRI